MLSGKSQKMALTGVIAALCSAILFLTGVIPIATVALPALAGCLLIAVVVEVGVRWAFGAYAVCAVLALLFVPDREAALLFLMFLGYYPVLYALLGRIRNRPLRLVAKLAVFNAAVLLAFWIAVNLLNIPVSLAEEIPFLGRYAYAAALILLNSVFLLYDRALDGLIVRYLQVIRPKVRQVFRLR